MKHMVPSLRVVGMVFAATLLTAGSVAGSLRPTGPGTSSDALAQALETARRQGVYVADATHVVDADGHPQAGARVGAWRNRLANDQPTSPALGLPAQARQVVVVVHGFNKPPDGALRDGLALQRMIDAVHHAQPAEPGAEMVLFLWRGDLGATSFSAAQRAATASAPSLLDVVRTVRNEAPRARVVVIAHSLGTLVALDALKAGCPTGYPTRTVYDSLVLVQGAVHAVSIRKWQVSDLLATPASTTDHQGDHAHAIRCAGQLVYTVAARDHVLTAWFRMDEAVLPKPLGPVHVPRLPSATKASYAFTALGTPLGFDDALEPIPKLVPSARESAGLRMSPNEPALRRIDEWQALFRFSHWRIDHPNVQQLDLARVDGLDAARVDWHSPIFSPAGAPVVASLWRAIARAPAGAR